MEKRVRSLMIIIAVFWLSPFVLAFAQEPAILILHSYSSDFPWTAELGEVFQATVRESYPKAVFFSEFLQTKQFPYQQVAPITADFVSKKYRGQHLDGLYLTDDNALYFYLEYQDQLDVLKHIGSSVVAAGLHDQIPGYTGSGVIESLDFSRNLRAIARLHPGASTIMVLTDETELGQSYANQITMAAADLQAQGEQIPPLTLLPSPSTDQLRKQLLQAPASTPILYLSYFVTKTGELLTLEESFQLIESLGSFPIYSFWEDTLQFGALGGYMVNANQVGTMAGTLMVQRFAEPPGEPQLLYSDNPFLINTEPMERFSLSREALPDNTVFIDFEPTSAPGALENQSVGLGTAFPWVLSIAVLGIGTGVLLLWGFRRKKAVQLLVTIEKALHTIDLGVYITDPLGRIIYANNAMSTISGYPKDELLGQTPRLFKSGLQSREYYEQLWNTLGNHTIWSEQIINRRRDGSLYTAAQTIHPVLSRGSLLEGFIAVQRDVTEQRRMEEALRNSEIHYRLLAENATDMISRHAPDGAYLYASPASRDLIGYDPQELIGKDPYTLFHPEDVPDIRLSHKQIYDMHQSSQVTYRIHHKNGSWRWVETTSKMVVDAHGDVTEIIAITRDVSERQQRNRELIQEKERAEAADRAKSAFLANMSHEIRTPLNGIIGFASLIHQDSKDPAMAEYAHTIERSGNHLLDLINDILDLSKIEAGMMVIRPEETNIRVFLEELVQLFQGASKNKGIDLRLYLSQALLELDTMNYLFDPLRLRQILVNLLGNAIKFTEHGGVTLTCDLADNGNTLIFEVADTGIGIPPEKIEQIYTAFNQVDNVSQRKFNGAGLGLTISYRLTQQMEGSLRVYSRAGEGTTVRLQVPTFPLRKSSSPVTAPEGTIVTEDFPEIEGEPNVLDPGLKGVESRTIQQNEVLPPDILQSLKELRSRGIIDEIITRTSQILDSEEMQGIPGFRNRILSLHNAAVDWNIEAIEREWNVLFHDWGLGNEG